MKPVKLKYILYIVNTLAFMFDGEIKNVKIYKRPKKMRHPV